MYHHDARSYGAVVDHCRLAEQTVERGQQVNHMELIAQDLKMAFDRANQLLDRSYAQQINAGRSGEGR